MSVYTATIERPATLSFCLPTGMTWNVLILTFELRLLFATECFVSLFSALHVHL